jgi:alpha-glucosidase
VRETDHETWWQAEMAIVNPVTHYRFLLAADSPGRAHPDRPRPDQWVNGAGTWHHDVDDAHDFVITTHAPPPTWLAGAVAYQVFPDRFARSDRFARPDPPAWAVPARWDTPPSTDPHVAVRELYGGDLHGVTDHLDHLERLGVTLLYLTPFFPARSSHRYDASSFDVVDPLLGGDAALAELTAAAHARGIRVIGDLTTNHTGATHHWFRSARADPSAPEAGFYVFGEHPDGYESWLGVRSLPKLDHRSEALRARLLVGPDSVVARWLRPPVSLDGWRIDVANMTARLGATDLNRRVARDIRATMAVERPDGWLVAEHSFDAGPDLLGDGWHGTMAYAWFTRPAWCWLAAPGAPEPQGGQGLVAGLPGHHVVDGIRTLLARVPWPAVVSSMTLLDSHDTSRFADVAATPAHHRVGLAWLLTAPGVPLIFAGDEVGVRGRGNDAARRPFPWDDSTWDHDLLEEVRALVALRRRSVALQRGGLRFVHAGADSITFVREVPDETVLVHLTRADGPPVVLPVAAVGGGRPVVLHGRGAPAVEGDRIVLPGAGPAAMICAVEPAYG